MDQKLTSLDQMRKLALQASADSRGQVSELAEATANALKEMGENKQDKLTGQQSQVAGFNAAGELEAQSTETLRGPAGADGKSAYQYAVDGGYTGTEAEFQTILGNGPWLPLTGGTLTGALVVQAPTANMNPATKKYVDDLVGGIATILDSINGEVV